jgi:hypothetical protein
VIYVVRSAFEKKEQRLKRRWSAKGDTLSRDPDAMDRVRTRRTPLAKGRRTSLARIENKKMKPMNEESPRTEIENSCLFRN